MQGANSDEVRALINAKKKKKREAKERKKEAKKLKKEKREREEEVEEQGDVEALTPAPKKRKKATPPPEAREHAPAPHQPVACWQSSAACWHHDVSPWASLAQEEEETSLDVGTPAVDPKAPPASAPKTKKLRFDARPPGKQKQKKATMAAAAAAATTAVAPEPSTQ